MLKCSKGNYKIFLNSILNRFCAKFPLCLLDSSLSRLVCCDDQLVVNGLLNYVSIPRALHTFNHIHTPKLQSCKVLSHRRSVSYSCSSSFGFQVSYTSVRFNYHHLLVRFIYRSVHWFAENGLECRQVKMAIERTIKLSDCGTTASPTEAWLGGLISFNLITSCS